MWKKIGGILIFLAVTVALVRANQSQVFTINFVDESDNFVIGYYANQGKKMYGEIFSHHQPIPYIGSAWIQKITKINTNLMLVKRHREVMILWSVVWLVFLIWRFGWRAAGVGLSYELIKHFYLGYMFLAEAIVVYPLLFCLGLLTEDKYKKWELVLMGVCLAIIAWALAPMWPMVGLLGLIMMVKNIKNRKNWLWLGLGFLVVSAIVLSYIDLAGYWKNAIGINQKYYIPYSLAQNQIDTIDGIITKPLRLLFETRDSGTSLIIKVWIVALIGLIIKLLKEKKFIKVSIIMALLIVANIRNTDLRFIQIDGFNLIPWLITILGVIWWEWGKKKSLMGLTVLGLVLTVVMIKSGPNLFGKRDTEREFHVYYSRGMYQGEVINILKKDDDKLLDLGCDVLNYWRSGVKAATPYIFYYPWMTTVPKFVDDIDKTFKEKPPTIVCYGGDKKLNIDKYLDDSYVRSKNRGGDGEIYLLRERASRVTNEEKEKIRFFGFEF